MACKTVSVLGAATQQVAIPSRLPQTQSDWQTFTQQLNTLFSQLSTTARRPAATSVPIQYATLFSSTLPPLQTTNCTVTADNSWALFGGFSYKIVVTGANASVVCGASGFPLPIPPNENWLLSVYGKCSGASQSFKMGLQTANNTYQNTVITDATATTVDRFAIPLNLVADDASQCTLRLDFPSASGQTFWFDGFQYEPSVTGSINPSPFLSTNIIAGSIVAQFITVAQLSALSANMGTLTAGKIQSSDGRFTIDCTNELITITDGTNTRMQIGEVSAGVYDVKIWNGSGTLLFDAATGLQYAGNSTQVTQVINNNSGNGQLNVNPTGGVTNNLPHANQSNQTLQVIADVGGNGQLNVSPTGGVTNTLPYANHAPSVTTTIVNTPDGNGSYLGHGVVFQPHIHANQIGWGHFIGDTSGNYSGNLVDGLNLRFLHGAMSTGVQGVISSGSQVNVNPAGGVTGNLPYANHDVSVRTTLASTAGGDGSYLNAGQVFNRHLNNATQSGLAGDADAKQFQYGTLAGRPAATGSGAIYHAHDAGTNGVTYRDNGVGSWIEVGVGHLADINGTTDDVTEGTNKFAAEHGADITSSHASVGQNIVTNPGFESNNVGTPSNTSIPVGASCSDGWTVLVLGSGVTAELSTATPHSGVYCAQLQLGPNISVAPTGTNYTAARIQSNNVSVKPGDVLTVSIWDTLGFSASLPAGINLQSYAYIEFASATSDGFDATSIGTVTTGPLGWTEQPLTITVPNGAAFAHITVGLYVQNTNSTATDMGSVYVQASFDDAAIYVNDVRAPDSAKAYVDFSDTTAGGHLAKSNWADATQMGTNIQGGTSLTDGETITFANAYSADPEIVFGDGGLTYDSTLGAVSQFQDFSASFTHSGGQTTGFTAALKISTVGGALTPHSQNFSSDSVTLSIAAGVIANGALTVSGNVHNSQSEINIITITLTDTTNSISWQKNLSVPAAGNKPFSFAITDTSAANGTVFTLGYSSGGSDSGTPTISYQTQTAATVHSATPAGVPGVNWVAFSTS